MPAEAQPSDTPERSEMPNEVAAPDPFRGLSEADAYSRLKTEGYNELPRPARRTPLRIAVEVLREPMLALLIGGGAIYLALGDLKEATILLAFATMSVMITVVQETRTERVLEALRDLTSPRALVIREGQRRRIPGREVVRGDFVVLSEGDRVPADAVLVQSQDLQTDESLLTGESVPVRKIARSETLHRKYPDRVATIFRMCFQVHWSCAGVASVMWWRLARKAKLARLAKP